MNQFSLQVKEYLLRNNLKQKDIVEKLGLSKNAISQSLNRDNISLDKMLLIADALDCDLEIKLVPRDARKD
jgi:transcriptional regulator with XRE-family HTH domain